MVVIPEFNNRMRKKKEYLKLFLFVVNPDNVWGARLHRSKGLSRSCRDRNIWEVSKTMYNSVHYTEFHLLSSGSKSREI